MLVVPSFTLMDVSSPKEQSLSRHVQFGHIVGILYLSVIKRIFDTAQVGKLLHVHNTYMYTLYCIYMNTHTRVCFTI